MNTEVKCSQKEESTKNTQKKRRRNRSRKRKPATQRAKTTTQNMPKVKPGEETKKIAEIVKDLSDAFIGLVSAINICDEIIPQEKLNHITDYVETNGNMSGVGYALSVINQRFPIKNYLPKRQAEEILSIIEDDDICDIDEGICFDEID